MASTYPIYQHSGETEKIDPIAAQASITEDIEKRRRQLDSQGEARKIIVAKEIANMIDEGSSQVHLHATSFEKPAAPILEQAQEAASNVLYSAIETGKSILHSATSASELAAEKVSAAAGAVRDTTFGAAEAVTTATKDAASTATHIGTDAANAVTSATKNAAARVTSAASAATQATKDVAYGAADTATKKGYDAANAITSVAKGAVEYVSHAAQEAAHQASALAGNVTTKAREIAETASLKAHEVADNITHFTTLIGVIALEEKERERRLNDSDETLAVQNAQRVADLIRELGPSFYRQGPINQLYSTKLLEEIERRWRLNAPYGSLAESNAHSEGKLVAKNIQKFMPRYEWVRAHINTIEEKERIRRLNDTDEAYAILNALALSRLIQDLDTFYRQDGAFSRAFLRYGTTLLEENERRSRIRAYKLLHQEDSAHQLMDVVANNIEKFNYTTRHAAHFANDLANKLGHATIQYASSFSQKTKELAQTTVQRVRAVAGDLSHFASAMYMIALEENERARRLNDPDEIWAIQNAWKQSSLIRGLEGFYRPASVSGFPTSLLESLERTWRIQNILKPTSSRAVARIVEENLSKFESASQRWAAKLEIAAHSRLNPKAPVFVPAHTVQFEQKVEQAAPAVSSRASGAQL